MKRFAILLATVCMFGFVACQSEALAQGRGHGHSGHQHRGHHGHGHHSHSRSGFAISIGGGGFYNPGWGFSYGNYPRYGGIYSTYGRPVYGGYGYRVPSYRPVYGGYGYRRGCGGGGLYIGW